MCLITCSCWDPRAVLISAISELSCAIWDPRKALISIISERSWAIWVHNASCLWQELDEESQWPQFGGPYFLELDKTRLSVKTAQEILARISELSGCMFLSEFLASV